MRWLEKNLLSGCQPFWYSDHKLVARDKTLLVKNQRPFALKCMTYFLLFKVEIVVLADNIVRIHWHLLGLLVKRPKRKRKIYCLENNGTLTQVEIRRSSQLRTLLKLVVVNRTWKKFRPVRDMNPWPLRYRCSALPIEPTGSWSMNWELGTQVFYANAIRHLQTAYYLEQHMTHLKSTGTWTINTKH